MTEKDTDTVPCNTPFCVRSLQQSECAETHHTIPINNTHMTEPSRRQITGGGVKAQMPICVVTAITAPLIKLQPMLYRQASRTGFSVHLLLGEEPELHSLF